MVPSSNNCNSLFMTVFGMLQISWSPLHIYPLLIAQESIIASSDTVGELVSNFVLNSHCDFLLANALALMVPACFSFKNIKYRRALYLCFHDKSSFLSGSSASYLCNWLSSLSSASFLYFFTSLMLI